MNYFKNKYDRFFITIIILAIIGIIGTLISLGFGLTWLIQHVKFI